MPNLLPAEHRNALSLAITRGDTAQVKYLVEEYALDPNAFLDDSPTCMPVLMDALLSYGFPTEEERLPLLHYLLERGANPNICSRKGYNCLHVAVQQDKYIKALDLLLDYNADVNVQDADGANVVYWAIQGFLLRKSADADRAEHLRVLEKILHLGADLDQRTRYDMNAREWLEHAAPEVRALVARWEESRPTVRRVTTVQPKFPTHLQYPGIARKICDAPTSLPGELLAAVETLREEAQQNGNAGYRRQHKRMVLFVRDKLTKSGIFDKEAINQIRYATDRLMKASKPYMEDDIYDQLVDRICIFYTRKAAVPAESPSTTPALANT